jgi:hypothetical protein
VFDRIEQSELANCLKSIVFIERDIEAAKINLALKPDFNMMDAFRMFDIKALGSISLSDLMDGLRQNLEFIDYTPDDVG